MLSYLRRRATVKGLLGGSDVDQIAAYLSGEKK